MVHNSKFKSSYKMLAIVLSLIICVTFMPFVGGVANAAQKTKIGKAELKAGKSLSKVHKIGASTNAALISVSNPNSSGYVTVKGQIPSDIINGFKKLGYNTITYDKLYVDGYYERTIGTTSMNVSVDMKSYDVGYHNIYVTYLLDGQVFYNNGSLIRDMCTFVPTKIYGAPGNGAGRYDVYHNKMFYNNSGNVYSHDSSCDTYIDYKSVGKKKWNKRYMDSLTSYSLPGITPGKKVQTKVYYGKKFTYNGHDYFFSGRKSGTTTMKAGTKKMKVKKITVKAYKIKRHPIKFIYRYWTSWYTYRLKSKTIGHYYTYRLKAVVKLKKKPGAKGIMINKYRINGNKKVYVKKLGKFSSRKKPRKTRYKIFVTSYQNKVYGGWSPQIKKSCKVK